MLETIEPWVGQPLVKGLRQRAQLCASCLRTARRAVHCRLTQTCWRCLERLCFMQCLVCACELAQRVSIFLFEFDAASTLAPRLCLPFESCTYRIFLPALGE